MLADLLSHLITSFCTHTHTYILSNMSTREDPEHINTIEDLPAGLERLKISAASRNVNIDGVSYSSEIIEIHNLLKQHKLIYNVDA